MTFLSSLEILVFRGMDDSSFISGLGGWHWVVKTHIYTHTQIHTYPHTLWNPHHLSDSWQSWQIFLPPTTTSIPTVRDPEGLIICYCERRKPTLDFPPCADGFFAQPAEPRAGERMREGASSCIQSQLQRWPSLKKEFFECVHVILRHGGCRWLRLHTPKVAVFIQPGCWVD